MTIKNNKRLKKKTNLSDMKGGLMRKIFFLMIFTLFLFFNFTVCHAANQNVPLKAGWNLIGISIDNVPATQLGDAEKIITVWDWSNNKWQIFSQSASINSLLDSYGITKFSSLYAGKGYWVNVKSSVNEYIASLSGEIPDDTLLNLSGGSWMLSGIKNPDLTSIKPSDFFSSATIKSIWLWKDSSWAVWRLNSDILKLINDYSIPVINNISKNEGFWINFSGTGVINFKSGTSQSTGSNIYGAFIFPPSPTLKKSSDNFTLEFPPSPVIGNIQGINDKFHEVVFASDNGTVYKAPVSENGTFELELPPMPFTISLTKDGRFETAAFSEKKSDAGTYSDNTSKFSMKYENGKLVVDSGNFKTEGNELNTDNGTPVGLNAENKLLGLTDKADTLVTQTTAIDADRDGIPDIFDTDADGDGIIDSIDDKVLALTPPPMPGFFGFKFIPGAFSFSNLKIDPDTSKPDVTMKFMFNEDVMLTLGFRANDYKIPGYIVDNVSIQKMPSWSSYGFNTTFSDWEAFGGNSVGIITNYDGSLYQGTGFDNETWQVWLRPPIDNGTLSALYPDYVANSGRIPLTFSFVDNMTKPDIYILKITYKSVIDNSTMVKYSITSNTYTFRTPPLVETIQDDNSTCNYDIKDENGCGHFKNPFKYSGSGDLVITGLPPKLSDGTSLIMWGTMNWKPTIFYLDASGNQIGSAGMEPNKLTSTPSSHPYVTVPSTLLSCSNPSATDINGDGHDEMYPGHTWSEVTGMKIDFTAETLSSKGGNAALFVYLEL